MQSILKIASNKILSLFKWTLLFICMKKLLKKLMYYLYYNHIVKCNIPYSTILYDYRRIRISSGVTVGRLSWLAANPLTGDNNCQLKIGKNSYIGNFAHIYCTSNIEIAENVLIADRVYISDNLHKFEDINIPIILQPIKQLDSVRIETGVWIGENVSIIGASIGKNSVIGANTVVTKSIPDYCVAVGSPARIVKRFCHEKQEWIKTDKKGNFLDL